MTASSIHQELVNMQSATAVQQAKDKQTNGPSQELDGDAFLMLMMEQLKNQDPLDPMDNSEMLAQQAQFTQIQELQKLNSTITSNNTIQQANSLVGKSVQVVDPNNTSRLISGVVTSANFSGDTVTVTVNGKEYPLGLVAAVTDGATPSENSVIEGKKLNELNNATGITSGYITLTMQTSDYQRKNVEIQITDNMTVKDFMKKLSDAGVNAELSNGVLTIEKGTYNNISLAGGKPDNSTASASNILEKMQMFQNENGDIETCVLDFNRN